GKTIKFTFSDEPQMLATVYGQQLTWCRDFAKVFHNCKGYDIKPFLENLLKVPESTDSKELIRARIDFHDVCSILFVKRFLLPIRKWCRQHKLIFGGHLNGEDAISLVLENGPGHIMHSLRAFDMPGVDVIRRQLFPGIASEPFPKYASSIARQLGKKYVMAEVFAVYGNGITPYQQKWLIDYLLVRGINCLVFSKIAFSNSANFMSGCRPHLGPADPLWKYARHLNNYTGRLATILSRGRPVVSAAIYFDMDSIWTGHSVCSDAVKYQKDVAETLFQRQCDFDFIDDDALLKAKIHKGKLGVGCMTYDMLVTRKCTSTMAGINIGNPKEAVPLLQVEPPTSVLRVCKRIYRHQTIYFAVNESEYEINVVLTLKETGPYVLFDPDTDTYRAIDAQNGRFPWHFEPFGSALFVSGKRSNIKPSPAVAYSTDFLYLDNWMLQPLWQYHCGKHDFEKTRLKTKAFPVEIGDWRVYLGNDFSGDAIYSTNFNYSRDAKAVLYLGEVKYSCSVKLNGCCVGEKLWGPFIFNLKLKAGCNRLEIIVTNTLANALSSEAVLTHLKTVCSPLSPYEDEQRRFEQDSLPSGLFGPVKIMLQDTSI
ncbi:MAG: glycosyl hydrolase, partial [Victivallales bacterium]|nr:glycosyl hydrolase [Victivallales bacterium]